MPVQDKFEGPIAYNPAGGTDGSGALVPSAEFQVFDVADSSFSTPLAVFDPATGVTINPLRSSAVGVLPDFQVAGARREVLVRSGSFVTRLTSKYGVVFEAGLDPETVQAAIAAGTAAESARAAAVEAKTDAEAAAADVAAVVATNDGIMKAVLENPDAGFTRELSSTFAESNGLVRVSAQTLPTWSRKRALSKLGQAPARLLCVGDSTTAGVYSDSYSEVTGSTNQGGPNSYPVRLAARLTALGLPAYHALSLPGHDGNDDARWSLGWWGYAGGNIGAGANASLIATSGSTPLVLTPGVKADRYIVYFFGDPGTGVIKATATGGSTVTISTIKASGAVYASAVVPAGSASAGNTLSLVRDSGTVFVLGVEAYDSTNPSAIRVLGAGVGSSRAENWADAPNSSLFGGRAFIKGIAPDLTVISLGINDGAADRPASTVLGHVETLAVAAALSGDVLLASAIPHPSVTRVDEYNAAFRATTHPYVDFQARYGHAMQSMGLMTSDGTHPNALGYDDMAHQIATSLIV